ETTWRDRAVGSTPATPDLVVRSAAIDRENPELIEARRLGIPVLTHAQAIGALMQGRVGVAIAGTHGKSTTTAWLGLVLERAGLDPTVLVGAGVPRLSVGARGGEGPHFVVEADEYDRRFLELAPNVAVITSLEPDHLDYFGSFEAIIAAFQAFAERVRPDGVIVTCADEIVLDGVELPRARVRYGFSPAADWRIEQFEALAGGGARLCIASPHGPVAAAVRLSGRHNALNAAAVLAAAAQLGVSPAAACRGLAEFSGAQRRFETTGRGGGVWVVDDYAHHPTAVAATLAGARGAHGGRIWVVFEPHTEHRARTFLAEFAVALSRADRVTVLPIFQPPGRLAEAALTTPVTSHALAARISGPPSDAPESLEAAEALVLANARPGDLVLVMGAGRSSELARRLGASIAARADT
ncbi:MAG: UDP-N-acetylmuramate--L-alanine ligase, partial [Chloroflexi bacterium]|nr:UDP-N-acetylmuramate--L-alanine ligase [Chloroflexota bacterium]